MRLKHLLSRSFLLAAGLLAGTSAWAGTTTYDFTKGLTTVTVGTASLTFNYSDADHTVYQCQQAGFERFYFHAATGTTNDNKGSWYWRDSSWGLCSYKSGVTGYLSIDGLLAGDKVTISVYNGSVTLCSSNVTDVTAGTAIASASKNKTATTGTTITMASAGHLDLSAAWCGLRSIVIESSAETVTSPSIAATAANGGQRTVTITPGASSETANTVKTYYTIDGETEPAATTGTEYTAPFTIESTTTVKAVTISSTGLASSVTTTEIAAGTTLSLASITSTLSNMSETSGVYYPVYTFANDNSKIIGSPASTLSAKFTHVGGTATDVELTDNSYTFTQFGTLTVTASVTGYDAVSADVTVSKSYALNRTYDFTSESVSEDDMVNTYGWTKGNDYYTASSTSTAPNITIGNIDKWRWYTSRGFYNGNSGGRAVTLQTANEGEVALYYYYNTTTPAQAVEYNNGISWNMPRYNTLQKIVVYSLANASVTISDAKYATFVTPAALDFSSTDVKAFAVKYDNGAISYSEVTAVPANTAVLVYAEAGTYSIPVAASADALTDNSLVAATAAVTCDGTQYVLANGDSGLGWYKAESGTIAAGKGYLKVETATTGEAKSFYPVVDNTVTAIEAVNGEEEAVKNQNIYNLAGQRVSGAYKGVVIKGGKKYIVK